MPTEAHKDTWHIQSPEDMTDTQRLDEIAALMAGAVRREESANRGHSTRTSPESPVSSNRK